MYRTQLQPGPAVSGKVSPEPGKGSGIMRRADAGVRLQSTASEDDYADERLERFLTRRWVWKANPARSW